MSIFLRLVFTFWLSIQMTGCGKPHRNSVAGAEPVLSLPKEPEPAQTPSTSEEDLHSFDENGHCSLRLMRDYNSVSECANAVSMGEINRDERLPVLREELRNACDVLYERHRGIVCEVQAAHLPVVTFDVEHQRKFCRRGESRRR